MNKERYRKAMAQKRLANKDKPCECCGKEHDHTYGTGRFCSKECKAKYVGERFKNAHNPKVKAHLDKLRAEGKVAAKAPYGTWTCKVCGMILDTRNQLKDHMTTAHGLTYSGGCTKMNDGTYACNYCGKVFNDHKKIAGHCVCFSGNYRFLLAVHNTYNCRCRGYARKSFLCSGKAGKR